MHNHGKAVFFILLVVCSYLGLLSITAFGNDKPAKKFIISKGVNIPEFTVNTLDSKKHREYLGIEGLEPFPFSQVSAELIVLEIFSYICTHCRKQALVLNDVYNRIKQDKSVANSIKIIGLAAASNQAQVDKWKTTFNTPFPLIPDPKQKIYMKFGRPPVPCTLFLNSHGKVLAVHFGAAKDIDVFFQELLNARKEATHGSNKENCGGN
jgi:peroxiredoxin